MKDGTKNSIKAALMAALWTFVGVFLTGATGWLQDVSRWAGGDTDQFPSVSALVVLAVSAAASALGGLAAFCVRYLQTKNVLPGQPPQYGQQ